MKLLFGKSNWEMASEPFERFLERAVADGFDAIEAQPQFVSMGAAAFSRACSDHNLVYVGAVSTHGPGDDHIANLRRGVEAAAALGAVQINCHTGSDRFSEAENGRIFEEGFALEQEVGVPVIHETHRRCAMFAAPVALAYMRRYPELRINADLSHWTNVHEGDLSPYADELEMVISRADYIHARVGYSNGPQVPHPFAPEWKEWLGLFSGWWRSIVQRCRDEGRAELIITPEAGPPSYMPLTPFTGEPVADAWDVNVAMRDYLRSELEAAS